MMPIFIVLCLALSFMVQTEQPFQAALISPWVTYPCIAVALSITLGIGINKLKGLKWYDFFASCLLLAWFSYWKPLFVYDSPIFFAFPIYFTVITVLVTVFFIGRRDSIDTASFGYLIKVGQHSMTQPWVIMLYTVASLYMLEHFLQFPVAMTLLIFRFALSGCLQRET